MVHGAWCIVRGAALKKQQRAVLEKKNFEPAALSSVHNKQHQKLNCFPCIQTWICAHLCGIAKNKRGCARVHESCVVVKRCSLDMGSTCFENDGYIHTYIWTYTGTCAPQHSWRDQVVFCTTRTSCPSLLTWHTWFREPQRQCLCSVWDTRGANDALHEIEWKFSNVQRKRASIRDLMTISKTYFKSFEVSCGCENTCRQAHQHLI